MCLKMQPPRDISLWTWKHMLSIWLSTQANFYPYQKAVEHSSMMHFVCLCLFIQIIQQVKVQSQVKSVENNHRCETVMEAKAKGDSRLWFEPDPCVEFYNRSKTPKASPWDSYVPPLLYMMRWTSFRKTLSPSNVDHRKDGQTFRIQRSCHLL